MRVTRRMLGGAVLSVAAASTVGAIVHRHQLVFCDFTEMAYQTPQFIDHYLSGRQHSISMGYEEINGTRQPVETFSYSGDTGSPGLSVIFYKGRAIYLIAHFFEPLPASEAARRVGLSLSAFQPVSGQGHRYIPSELDYTGAYKDVSYKELSILNIKYSNTKDQSRLVIARLTI